MKLKRGESAMDPDQSFLDINEDPQLTSFVAKHSQLVDEEQRLQEALEAMKGEIEAAVKALDVAETAWLVNNHGSLAQVDVLQRELADGQARKAAVLDQLVDVHRRQRIVSAALTERRAELKPIVESHLKEALRALVETMHGFLLQAVAVNHQIRALTEKARTQEISVSDREWTGLEADVKDWHELASGEAMAKALRMIADIEARHRADAAEKEKQRAKRVERERQRKPKKAKTGERSHADDAIRT